MNKIVIGMKVIVELDESQEKQPLNGAIGVVKNVVYDNHEDGPYEVFIIESKFTAFTARFNENELSITNNTVCIM